MSQVYVLYNPLSGNHNGIEAAQKAISFFDGKEINYKDITKIKDYRAFIDGLKPDDDVLICGGDGTLNRFANAIAQLTLNNAVYYYATGNGNDFLRDIGKKPDDGPIKMNDYLHHLPTVEVNGKTYSFINGVGYGIDGYCCEVGEDLRSKGKVPNYTSIAIKGLLFHHKAANATITVDGKKYHYKRVWIAPTMHGRYYGGGMMAAPDQVRNKPENGITLVLMHKSGRLATLCVFPSIFSGKHVKHEKTVAVHNGRDITVEFDRPTTLQIDGEVILNVTKYRACLKVPVKSK